MKSSAFLRNILTFLAVCGTLVLTTVLIPLAIAAIAPALHPFTATFPGRSTLERPIGAIPVTVEAFAPFQKRLGLSWEDDFFYIEGNGVPDHNMMIGITAWQQQVPLPQAYVGENAWRVPLKPVPAAEPAMIDGRFLRGAIAIGVNGIPIFNPQNNRGEVSYEIGELDQWGGHCGRADDYHYHIAPLHLESIVGAGKPVAYALDGYPILGLKEPGGSEPKNLDDCHGHEHDGSGYHYHASSGYPYVFGGFHGEVAEAEGQVDPQPRAQPVREALQALRGAEITGFAKTGENAYELSYEVNREKHSVRYHIGENGTFPFEFDNGAKGVTREVYTARPEGGEGGDRPSTRPRGEGNGGGDNRPERPPGGGGGPRPDVLLNALDSNHDGIIDAEELGDAEASLMRLDANQDGKLNHEEATGRPGAGEKGRGDFGMNPPPTPSGGGSAMNPSVTDGFVLTSPEVENGGRLPMDYTGDGSGSTLPLAWQGAPADTKSYALIMDHLAPGDEMKGYWVLWNIPAKLQSLAKNATGIGKEGIGFRGETGYEPPHSKGPGDKTYVLHLYALSTEPEIKGPPSSVNREVLLAAMEGKILATADLSVVYASSGTNSGKPRPKLERQ